MAYIITDNDVIIYGTGDTVDAAWDDARATLAAAQVELIGDDVDSTECLGSWTRESGLRCVPASDAVIAAVMDEGGDIAWRTVGGVAVTTAEAYA
jgi:hypothetical protein